jgi:hypothetical protein
VTAAAIADPAPEVIVDGDDRPWRQDAKRNSGDAAGNDHAADAERVPDDVLGGERADWRCGVQRG